jgi:hypothetical protein
MEGRMKCLVRAAFFAAAVALMAAGCALFPYGESPIFADTDLMDVSYENGQFECTLPHNVAYLVLGIFQKPIVTYEKGIENMYDMKGGSRTGLVGFNSGYVSEDSLYTYDDTVRNFTGLPGEYDPSGPLYWAFWGFNADWVIIASSQQMKTTFP